MNGCTFTVRLQPKAKRNGIISSGKKGVPLKVSVTSPPIDNKANDHCIRLLAKRIGCPRSAMSIVKGRRSRNKVIVCEGFREQDVFPKLYGNN